MKAKFLFTMFLGLLLAFASTSCKKLHDHDPHCKTLVGKWNGYYLIDSSKARFDLPPLANSTQLNPIEFTTTRLTEYDPQGVVIDTGTYVLSPDFKTLTVHSNLSGENGLVFTIDQGKSNCHHVEMTFSAPLPPTGDLTKLRFVMDRE
jgi:hypothetical protein